MALLGMGNPLLDISAKVDVSLLQKYNIEPNSAILYDKEDVFEELKQIKNVETSPGGSTLNTIRVAQWILGKNHPSTLFFGSIGKDEAGQILFEKLKNDSVKADLHVEESLTTGRCAVFITGTNRSLVTKLDAANHYKIEHLKNHWTHVQEARFYYSAGFFLTVCSEAMMEVAKHASATNKIYAFNLSATFLCQSFREPMNDLLPYTDIVFGNEDEAVAYAMYGNIKTTDVKSIAMEIANYKKENNQRSRIVVITQGCLPIIVVQNGILKEFEVNKIPSSQIEDTNGAGDAFVGGFLAQFIQEKPLEMCVKCGIWAATQIIQQAGCTLPETMTFNV